MGKELRTFFFKKKNEEGKKSRKTKRQKNIDPKREMSDQKRTETKKQKDGKHAGIIQKRRKIKR